jgi:hypothetical protein
MLNIPSYVVFLLCAIVLNTEQGFAEQMIDADAKVAQLKEQYQTLEQTKQKLIREIKAMQAEKTALLENGAPLHEVHALEAKQKMKKKQLAQQTVSKIEEI